MNVLIREEPLFRKCCFFLPLRLCLQTWAYIKVVADVLAMSYLSILIAILYGYDRTFSRELSTCHILALIVVALVVDVGFLVSLIVGVFKKSYSILRVYYFYEFYAMVAEVAVIALLFVHMLRSFEASFVIAMAGLLIILIDVCIILTVQSEMVKLRNKEQYDFSRMPVFKAEVEGTGKFTSEEQ